MIISGETIHAMRQAEEQERQRVAVLDKLAEQLYLAKNPAGRWFLLTDHQKHPWRVDAKSAH